MGFFVYVSLRRAVTGQKPARSSWKNGQRHILCFEKQDDKISGDILITQAPLSSDAELVVAELAVVELVVAELVEAASKRPW